MFIMAVHSGLNTVIMHLSQLSWFNDTQSTLCMLLQRITSHYAPDVFFNKEKQ